MTTTHDVVTFLRTRLDEDEQAAQDAHYDGQQWLAEEETVWRWPDDEPVHSADRKRDASHIVRWQPARVLAEVAAKRRIIELHRDVHECQRWAWRDPDHPEDEPRTETGWVELCPTVRLLALPYAGHPDYRAEWAPETR